jgi:hypothetical protein
MSMLDLLEAVADPAHAVTTAAKAQVVIQRRALTRPVYDRTIGGANPRLG